MIPRTILLVYHREMFVPGIIIGVERIGAEEIEASIALPQQIKFLSALCSKRSKVEDEIDLLPIGDVQERFDFTFAVALLHVVVVVQGRDSVGPIVANCS